MKQTLAMICSSTIGYGTILQPLHTLDTFSEKLMFTNKKRKRWIFWIKITSQIRLQAMWALIFFVSVIIEKGFTSAIYTIELGRFKGLGSCKGIILGTTGTKGVCTWITTDPALNGGEKWRLAPLFYLPFFCPLVPLSLLWITSSLTLRGGWRLAPPAWPWQRLIRSSSSPPWEGDGALLPRLTVASFDPLLLLLLPWAGGGDGKLHPRATLTMLDRLLFSPPFLCLFFSCLRLGLYSFQNASIF